MDGTVAAAKRFATLGENDAGPTGGCDGATDSALDGGTEGGTEGMPTARALSKRLATLGVSDGGWGESFVPGAVTAALPA